MQAIEEHQACQEPKETRERGDHVDQPVCPRITLYIMHKTNNNTVRITAAIQFKSGKTKQSIQITQNPMYWKLWKIFNKTYSTWLDGDSH